MNTYKHLSNEERHLIYILLNKEKYSMNKIAKILNINFLVMVFALKKANLKTVINYLE